MKRKLLATILAVVMVFTLLPATVVAAEDNDNNIALPVSWTRSENAANAIAVNGGFGLSQIYQTPNVNMTATWAALNAIDANIEEGADPLNNRVWDGGNPDAANHYTNQHLHGTYTEYPTATITGEGTTRFRGTFSLKDLLDAGTTLTNLKVGLSMEATDNQQIALNDQMFVFVYPADAVIDEANFMDYYVFGAGFQWINQWVPEGTSGTVSFNGVDVVRTFRDFGYYPSFGEEAAAYEAYGSLIEGLGYPGWQGMTEGWFGNGVNYRLYDDLANGALTGINHLYVSDGLFFHNFDSQLEVDLTTGYDTIPENWIIDIFAVNTDVVGGLSKIGVYANWEPTVTKNGVFSLQKMVEVADGYVSGEAGFVFNAYAGIDSEGNPVGDIIATATTNDAGIASFKSDDLVPGEKYYVFEAMDADQSLIYIFGAQGAYIEIVAQEDGQTVVAKEFFNDLIPGTGTLVIGKELGRKVDISGSITGGYPEEAVPNAKGKYDHSSYKHSLSVLNKNTWFQYNEFSNGSGGTFDLVQGDKLKDVGEYTITAEGNGWFTVSFPDLIEAVGARLSISNKILGAKNQNDKNYNANNIWTTSPGQQQFSFSGNSFRFYAPWVKTNETVYVYLHLDGLTGYADTYHAEPGQTFTVLVTGPSFPDGKEFEVPMNSSIRIENLKPGTYTIEELEDGWKATYYVNGSTVGIEERFVEVIVIKDEVTTVKMTNEPGVWPNGIFSIQKMVENVELGYIAGDAGFVFNAYAEIDADGNPVGNIIATATTGADGIARFNSKDLITGKTYYVFEAMTPEQELIYVFGAQGAYIEIVAKEDGEFDTAEDFFNDLAFGSITVTKAVEAYKDKVYSVNTVTGGDDASETVVQGSWMRPKYIDVTAILNGTPFEANLVAGSDLTPVGTYSISAAGDGGLVVELKYDEGVEANAITWIVFGNAYAGQSHSGGGPNRPGHYVSSSFGESVTIPADDVKAMTDASGNMQYLYLHSGIGEQTVTFDISDEYADVVFDFVVTDSDGSIVAEFSLKDGENYTAAGLEAGEYTVTETTTGWTTTYSVDNGKVLVVAGEDAPVTVTNKTVITVVVV